MDSQRSSQQNGGQDSSSDKEIHSGKQPAVEPSGPKGDNPATAGPGRSEVSSKTPENNLGHLNPSAPEDANTTPGTTGKK